MPDARSTTLAELNARLSESPFHQLFNMKIEAFDPTKQTLAIRLAYTPCVERRLGSRQYHGGVIASLIDIVGDYAFIALLDVIVPTINFRVDYLRSATDTSLLAVATVRKAGRTLGVVDIDVTDDRDRLIAIGRGCYGTTRPSNVSPWRTSSESPR